MKIRYRADFADSGGDAAQNAEEWRAQGHDVIESQESRVSWQQEIDYAKEVEVFVWTPVEMPAHKWRRCEADAIERIARHAETVALDAPAELSRRGDDAMGRAWMRCRHVFADHDPGPYDQRGIPFARVAGTRAHRLQTVLDIVEARRRGR